MYPLFTRLKLNYLLFILTNHGKEMDYYYIALYMHLLNLLHALHIVIPHFYKREYNRC